MGPHRPVDLDQRVSASGPGCVKTRSGKGGVELFSQLPYSESSCQHKPTLTSTKSRWKFCTEVDHRSFHTAWVIFGSRHSHQQGSLCLCERASSHHGCRSRKVPTRAHASWQIRGFDRLSDPLEARLGSTKRSCRAKNDLTKRKSYFRTASAKKTSCAGARSDVPSPDCAAVSRCPLAARRLTIPRTPFPCRFPGSTPRP